VTPSPAPVRLGVAGCGFIGMHHLAAAAASSLLEVVAVADTREEAVREAAARVDARRSYGTAAALLADRNVEAVVLATPAAGRADLACEAFAAGKHVLLEKPPAFDRAELESVVEARGQGLVGASCSSRFRNSPAVQAVAAFLRTGETGRIRLVRSTGTVPAPAEPTSLPPAWRLSRELNGGGILANWGSYDLDVILGVTGWSLRPASVFGRMYGVPSPLADYVPPGSDAETHALVVIACEGGESIVLQRSEYVPMSREDEICIVGERAAVRWALRPAAEKSVVVESLDPTEGVRSRVLWRGDDEYDLHRSLLDDFAGAVRGIHPPQTTLEQALGIQSVLDAAYASAREGEAVAVA
jgi:predicted dehydrogenase